MLRFKEGKQCVRNVPNWETQFMNLIHNRNCPPLVRLVTIVAYYEASRDPDAHSKSRAQPHAELSPDVFDDAKNCLRDILAAHKHRDGPRVVALLRPLTKHQMLRERILTQDVLETLVNLLDVIVTQPGGNFGQAMDGLNCLLQCEDTRPILIEKLGENPPNSNVSRLSRILEVNNPHLLTAALRMVLTLARIPQARAVCSVVKPRFRELAGKDERLVGLLAVEILLALYDPNDQEQQLNIRDARVRANLAGALVRLTPERHDSGDEPGRGVDPGQLILRRLFGLDAPELNEQQRTLIGELKKAVQKGDARERIAATMTLLKLCETATIRTYLTQINLLDVFIGQLRRKESALLAAYALVTCMTHHSDMKESIKDNEDLPNNIVGMLRLDYFDDAVGPVEGFQIFGDFMQHVDLREKIRNYNITEVLNSKLGKGKPKEIRTSLISLEIFRAFEPDGPWTSDLVKRSLEYLGNSAWKAQKAGVTILSALAQTEHGVAAIKPRIYEIIEMLLPEGYLPIQPSPPQPTPATQTSPSEGQTQPAATTSQAAVARSPTLLDAPPKPPSWMLGPACALRILAQNEMLRKHTRDTMQYGSLKHLYLSGTLIDETDTSPWRVKTPNRGDVINMLDKMIKAVDEELSEEGLMSIGDAVLPHIEHWDRLVTMVSHRAVGAITILPALLGVSTLAILAVIVIPPIYVSALVYGFLKQVRARYLDTRILERLRNGATHIIPHRETRPSSHEGESASGGHDGDGPSGGHGDEGPSDGHDSESSQGVEMTHAEGSGDPQGTTSATSQE
ncbi:hypothetical protein OG21DRAFT_1115422 [Imleria badia]|nr:hypothetical protein OG21DRAFT_1115422 [Imleria badia]